MISDAFVPEWMDADRGMTGAVVQRVPKPAAKGACRLLALSGATGCNCRRSSHRPGSARVTRPVCVALLLGIRVCATPRDCLDLAALEEVANKFDVLAAMTFHPLNTLRVG